MARPRVAAGALFLDAAGRVLLVRPTYKRHWDITGGYVGPGESPRAACIREIHEELGIHNRWACTLSWTGHQPKAKATNSCLSSTVAA